MVNTGRARPFSLSDFPHYRELNFSSDRSIRRVFIGAPNDLEKPITAAISNERMRALFGTELNGGGGEKKRIMALDECAVGKGSENISPRAKGLKVAK